MKFFEKNVKKLDYLDIGLIKWSVAGFVLFVLAAWPAALIWVASVSHWYFLIAFVILCIRPMVRFFGK